MNSLFAHTLALPLLLIVTGCTVTELEPTEPAPVPDRSADIELTVTEEPEVLPAETEAPVPVSAPEPMPQDADDLWVRIRDQFTLNRELDRRRVENELSWYRRNPEYVARVAKRASRHLHYITNEIEKRGMPLELALLPVVESAYDPYAYSHGRASGLWQFIPGTARLYGLRIDWWYDGRRDVVESTRAALDYLEYLTGLYDGDWLLALAAYNSGQGNVNAAIRRNRKAGKPEDFWSLSVPRETSAYVPRLLAISEIIANPVKYGIELKPIANEATWTIVDAGSQIDLVRAAELADLSTADFQQLNPGFNQWSTHPEGPHRLLVPVGHETTFLARLEELPPRERLTWTRHKIRSGESLGSIASKYKTSIDAIRATNNVRGSMIRAGDSLLIPIAAPGTEYPMSQDARLARSQEHLSKRLGQPVHHTVKPGDSFWSIAREYGVGMRELAKWNGMGTTTILREGQVLKVFGTGSRRMTSSQVRRVNYRVRRGESLSLIANRFNLSVSNIKAWNEDLANRKYLQPGDKLTLYVDVTATE